MSWFVDDNVVCFEGEPTKCNMEQLLSSRVLAVTFIKTDGTERKMVCSLHESVIPPEPIKEKGTKPRKENPDTIACWDLQKGGWRSFRLDSILSVVVLEHLHRPIDKVLDKCPELQ